VSAPGPKDSGSERPGPESRGEKGWTKGNPVVPAFDSQARDLKGRCPYFMMGGEWNGRERS